MIQFLNQATSQIKQIYHNNLDFWFRLLVVVTLLFFFFFKISEYPAFLDLCVPDGISKTIDSWLGGFSVTSLSDWTFKDIYLHAASNSPLYNLIIYWGIDWWPYQSIAIRFFPAFFLLMSLAGLILYLSQYYSKTFLLIFTVLLASSPWFLIIARSGSILALSLALLLFTSLMAIDVCRHPHCGWKTFILCIFICLLSYTHSSFHFYFFLFILFFLFMIKSQRVAKTSRLVFFITITIFLIFQAWYGGATSGFFLYARGENIFNYTDLTNHGGSDWLPIFFSKISFNCMYLIKIFTGWNSPWIDWQKPMLYRWDTDSYVYPRFLLPIILYCFWNIIWQLKSRFSWPLLIPPMVFLLTLHPGLAVGIGLPAPYRIYPAVILLYFFISSGFFLPPKFISVKNL